MNIVKNIKCQTHEYCDEKQTHKYLYVRHSGISMDVINLTHGFLVRVLSILKSYLSDVF